MSFLRTGLREVSLKFRRQKTRIALRHEKRVLQKAEINLGREGCTQAANVPEVREEIVALRKLEQEQKEVGLRIAQTEEALKQVQKQREENAAARNEAIAKLNKEKEPILQRRDQVKSASDLCDRELIGVERRLQANDAHERELLARIAALQVMAPPPADLDRQTGDLRAAHERLPLERAELVTARLGSAEACRLAKERLAEAENELAVMEKQISRVRGEYDTREKALDESSRTHHEALRESRAHHQKVEERKNPAYLNIGRHLADQDIAPPTAPHLLDDVKRHRQAMARQLEHKAELARLSAEIDKQELRKFYFSIVSVLAILAIVLPLVFQRPRNQEWLPQETDAVLSLNVPRLMRDELVKRWRENPDIGWPALWQSLAGQSATIPHLNVEQDAARITRGLTTGAKEFVLLETRGDAARFIYAADGDPAFHKEIVSGLPLWQTSQEAVARVGPRTLAVGKPSEVRRLVRVRLGTEPSLPMEGPLFDRFRALLEESSITFFARDPANIERVFQPIFMPELINAARQIGLALNLSAPAQARLFLKASSSATAQELERKFREEPQRWLRLRDAELFLFEQGPEVTRQQERLELRFNVPENAARLLLERLRTTQTPESVATR